MGRATPLDIVLYSHWASVFLLPAAAFSRERERVFRRPGWRATYVAPLRLTVTLSPSSFSPQLSTVFSTGVAYRITRVPPFCVHSQPPLSSIKRVRITVLRPCPLSWRAVDWRCLREATDWLGKHFRSCARCKFDSIRGWLRFLRSMTNVFIIIFIRGIDRFVRWLLDLYREGIGGMEIFFGFGGLENFRDKNGARCWILAVWYFIRYGRGK